MQPETRPSHDALSDNDVGVLEIPQAWSELDAWLSDLEQAALTLVHRIDPVLDGSHQLDAAPAKAVAAEAPVPSRSQVAGKIHDQTASVMRVTAILQRATTALAL